MATLIGVVSQVVGEVYAVAGDGTRRPLVEGDRVYAGEQLVTGANGAIAVTMTNGQELTVGRDSSMALNEQMLAGAEGTPPASPEDAAPAAPSDSDLTDVEQLQAAIEAGVDPTLEGEATAAGPGAGGGGGGAGGVGGGHSFVLLGETGGALDPTIGFPTEGLNSGPEFPDAEPIVTPDPEAPDFTPDIDIEYQDQSGTLIAGPAIVDEEGLADGTNPGSNAEQASGIIVINSPDGLSSLQVQDVNGNWIDVTNGGVVQGQYGTLTVSAGGAWTYTLTDNTFDHGNPNATGAADQVGESFPVRMFDLDGDVSPTVQLNVLVNDDGPILTEGEGAQVAAIVDEDETSDGISDGDSVTNVASGGPGTLSALVNFGADGVGSFGLSGSPSAIASLQAQDLSSGGTPLTYSVVGNVLTASAGTETIFTLQVGGDGSFSFTLVGQLDHPTPDGNDDELLELPIDFSGVLTATDGDGDSVGTFNGGSFVIDVEDDVPQLISRSDGEEQYFPGVWDIVHEDALTTGTGAPHDGNPEGGQTTTVSGPAGSLSALVNFGADGPGAFGLSSDVGSMDTQNLMSGGVPLTYVVVGNVLTASAGGETIFTLTVNADGSWEFVLQGPIDHPIDDITYDSEDLPGLGVDFSGILTATDGDGDPLAGGFPPNSFVVDIEDDVPVATPLEYDERQQPTPLVSAQVDEDELPGGIADGDGEGTTTTGVSGTLDAVVSFGADGPGAFGLTGSPAAIGSLEAQGLSSGGTPLTYSVVGNVLTAMAGLDPVFTLTINPDGGYSFELFGPLDHPLPGSTDDDQMLNLPIDFSGVLTASDGDGDTLNGFAPGTFVIQVEDDVPVAQDDNATVLAGQTQDINLVFVLDFSGSISNGELDQMLDAVRTAGQQLFATASGAVQIQIVVFSESALSFGPFNNEADFTDKINDLNPAEGGSRPGGIGNGTDFTDAIEEVMDEYVPQPDWSNQVVFISDGNPNQQNGPGGSSLETATATGWNAFLNAPGNSVNVTTIGVGNGILDVRLEEVDLDADPEKTPLRVDDFDDLVDTLLDVVVGGLVGGNLLLGDDNAVDGGDDDSFGADGPGQILSIDINGTTYTWDGSADGDEQLTDIATAEGGKLSFNFSTGAWSYQAPVNPVGDKTETFTYTIIDNDGDPSTANLTVYVEDTSPVVDQVDEDELSGGNTDGDAVNTIATGSLADLIVGPPVAAQFSLSNDTSGLAPATSNGVGLVYGVSGNVLTATAGPAGPNVFTLQVNSDGTYTFTLLGPLDHPAGGNDDNDLLVMDFASILQASDGVDPIALAGGFLIQIEDDLPIIETSPAPNDSLQVDETNLAANATTDFSTQFNELYGGDGPGTTTYALQISSGTDTGLDDAATGSSIRLYMQGNDVVGRVGNSGGPIAFRVSVNSATGEVTLDQVRAIEHSPDSGPDQEASLAAANQIQLVGTIVDDDGDSNSAALDLGHAISFKDDAPSISGSAASAGTLRVDESNLGSNDTDDFSGLFSGSFGADGPGDIDYDLSISAVGADSGLKDTASGQDILLFMLGGDVVGRVGGPGGAIAFRVSVNGSGDVTLDQQRAIVHSPDSGPDQTAFLAAANLIKLTATITDEDGDSDSATIDIGQSLAFEDDAPEIDGRSVSNDSLQVDETSLATSASTNFSGNFSSTYGADGPGTTVYSLNVSADGANSGLDDTATGQDILLYKEGSLVVGRVGGPGGEISFTVSVNPGTGVVTLDQQRAIFHTPNTGSNQESSLASANLIQLSATITDKDGDSDSATINLGQAISFRDDGPSLNASSATNDSLQVDETDLAADDTHDFSGNFSGGYGADGPGTLTYSLGISSSGVNTGLDDSATGQDIRLYMDGNDVVGRVGNSVGPIAFRVSVDANGVVKLDQLRAIEHEPNTTADQESSLGAANMVQLTATITDKDGDSDSETINLGSAISFKDDGPSVTSNAAVQLDDDALANGIAGGPGGTDDANSVGTPGFLGHDFGADGAGSIQWLTTGAPGGFTYAAGPGGSLLVKQGATTVLTVTLNSATGEYNVTQNAPIQHANADLENNQAFTLSYQVTDKDGDTATGTLSVNVDDDTPVAQDDVAYVSTGQTEDINMVFVLDFSGSISDSELNLMLDAVRTAGQELFNSAAGAVQIQIVAFSNDSIGYPAATDITTFTNLVNSLNPSEPGGVRPLDSTTDFTDAIQQTMVSYVPLPGWNNQVVFISDGNPNEQTGPGGAPSLTEPTATNWSNFVDGNGITITTIGIGDGINEDRLEDVDVDAGPNNDPLQVDDFDDLVDTLLDNVVGGLVNGNVLHGSDGINNGGTGDDDGYGADGPGRILSIEINGITYVWNGAGVIDPSSGANIAGNQLTDIPTAEGGELDFNFATGAWTYRAPSSGGGDKVETFDYVIVDKDGDPSEATLTVYVEDISPVIAKVDEDELPGGITDGDTETTIATGSIANLVVGPSAGVQFSLSGNTSGLDGASSGGTPLVYSVAGNTLTAKAGVAGPTVFTLQVENDGDYTFTLSGPLDHPAAGTNDNELLVLDFASILLASNGVNPVALAGQFLVQIENDVPTISAGSAAADSLQVDETNLAVNANASFAASFSGNYGGDGAGTTTYSLQVSASGVDSGLDDVATGSNILLFLEGGNVVGRVGSAAGAVSFTVSVNASGVVTLDQQRAIAHTPNTTADQESSLASANLVQLSATITDKDGDTATASVNLGSAISFKDDGPSISAGVVSANSLQVDETNLSTNASVSFAGAFTPSYGADGAGTTTYGLNVSAAGVDSGLDDAATGSNILLFLEGSNVVGRVGGAAGAVSFTVSVNASGVVTLDQQRAIMHTPNSGPDQEASLAAANLVQLTATITDRDGDSNNATINLGEAISFRDDAPSISATAAAGNDSLQVDETVLATNATTNFAGLFSGNYGADGAGTTTYSLNVSAAGVDSGLDDSVTGSNILLFNEAGVIVGRVGGAAGPVSFTVSVNASGQVTLDQQRAIIHTPNSGADQESSLSAANLVQLSATITDKDGDTATASVNLGNAISFRDDGPSISAATAVNDSLQVDETFLASNASTNYAALFTSSYGADGAGTTTYSLNVSAAGVDSGLDDSITGSNILLFNEAGVIVGRVGNAAGPVSFTVSVNASGQVTLDQQRAIVHTPNSGADQESSLSAANLVQLSATITDKDGDAATASVNLGSAISFRDDGPSISPNAVAVDSLQVDESNLAGNASTSFAGAFTGSYGADGAGTTVYSLNVSAAGVDSGLDDSLTGSNILLFLEAGSVVGRVGSAAGAISFTVAVNTSTGTVTLDQQRAIIHTPNSGPDQETSLASANLVQLTATITDKDGDATSASVGLGSAISFRDDAPTAVTQTQSGQATVSLNSNLLIVLDISGSMGWESGVGDMDRLQVAKNALLELLEQYDALGDVRVSLVSFSTGADVEATWVTVAQAKAAILSLNPEDSTNYDAALIDAINVYDDAGKLAAGNVQNVAYFLSDGFPNAPSGDAGISSTAGSAAGWPTPYSNGGVSEEQAWINFLTANNIRSYALGMGTGVDAGALNPIAYNGTTGGGNTNAIEVDDLNDLAATLTATAQASPIPGNLTTGGGFGSDGGFVQVLVVDGKTYTYDKATNTFVASGPGANNGSLLGTVLTVNMGGGSGIAVNMLSGSYTYTPPSVINTAVITTIAFTLIDADGDAAAANLNININPGQGPMVIRDDLILTNTDTQTGQDAISIPTWALLANDSGPSSGLLSVLNASGASDGSVGLAGSTVTFTEEGNNSTDGGRFVYGASINGSTTLDSAVVDVTRSAGSNTLNGTFRNEILLGRDGSADVLNGGDGDDVLIGLGGNDTLNGGEGNDILAGGAGTDTLNGGNGVDTANYIDAALGVTVSLNTGAAQNTVGAGTDTLSNIENLFGSNLIDTLTGNGSANVLFGAGGNDTLVGLGGDDFLIGGLGGDTMSGGSGKDTYVWQKGGLGGGTDHITDFNVDITGVNSDKLDLSQLLSGVGTDSNILQNYLDFSFAGTTTTIDVRTVAAGPVEQQVILDNVNLSTLYGSANEATIITNLLDDNALKTA